eukprot:m.65596 g.65596  ORF g.65596 m.65596 type:complete len:354 (-) comp16503_c0_seq1:164-1225(-)
MDGRLKLQVASQVAVLGLGYLLLRWLVKRLDPQWKKKEEASEKSKKVLLRLGKDVKLDEYESVIAADVVDPDAIAEGWEDIGGLDNIVAALKESVVLPFSRPDIFNGASNLLRPPLGILMYGPPGCGKTMLARALAKESGCCFINLKPSSFMDKWYGESQKLIAAVFSLAEKLQPSVIFIDEIDSFLRERTMGDHESSAVIKAQFMTLWDGFSSGNNRIIVVGATNRPRDVDRAILRRMPKVCHVTLPNQRQRSSIFKVTLQNEQVADDVDTDKLAAMTSGYSGSDIKELCRNAALVPVREVLQGPAGAVMRPIRMSDLISARRVVETALEDGSGAQENDDGDVFESALDELN